MLMGPCPPAVGVPWVWRPEEGPLQLRMAGPSAGVTGTAPARAGSAGIVERGVNVQIHYLPQTPLSLSSCLLPS